MLLAHSREASLLRDLEELTSLDVGSAARKGDRVALGALRYSAQALGLAIGNALNLLNLEKVILDGGVTRSGPVYLEWVRQTARARTIDGIDVEIGLSELDGEAPLWGASALAEVKYAP
jgi:glucokinase